MIRRGFSLLEVVVALSILSMIVLITFESISTTLTTRDALESSDTVSQSARVSLDRLRRDLRLAYLTKNTAAVNTYVTSFVGQNGDPDKLWFASLSHHRMYRESRECDQTEITYWTEEDPDAPGAFALMRREAPRIDNEPDKQGLIAPLAYRLSSLNFRYLNSKTGEWVEEWDSTSVDQANKLPRAVQIVLVFLDSDPDDPDRTIERPFATTVILHFADRMTQSLLSNGSSSSSSTDGTTEKAN